MKAWKWSLVVVSALTGGAAAAQEFDLDLRPDERGNGGGAVVCRDQQGEITSTEVLDHYEGRNAYRFTFDLGSPSYSYLEKIQYVLNRLGLIDPERATRYWQEAQAFESNTYFWPDAILVEIPDSGAIALPANCKVEQAAVQAEPQFPDEKYFTISKNIWDKMTPDSQAGLVLHEIIYKEALKLGQTNSRATRYFNGFISQGKMSGMALDTYLPALRATKLQSSFAYRYRGLILRTPCSDGYALVEDSSWTLPGGIVIPLRRSVVDQRSCSDLVSFDTTGELKKAALSATTDLPYGDGVVKIRYNVTFAGGQVTSGYLAQETPMTFAGEALTFKNQVEFYASGTPRSGTLAADGSVVQLADKRLAVAKDYVIEQSEAGRISKLTTPKDNYVVTFPNPSNGDLVGVGLRSSTTIWFNDDGFVKELSTGFEQIELPVMTYSGLISARIYRGQKITFQPNGVVAQIRLASDVNLMTTENVIKRFNSGANVTFDPQGRVIER